ncbi:Transposase zinc-binding domain-containing protein, partial [Paenibacillus barengoltzii]
MTYGSFRIVVKEDSVRPVHAEETEEWARLLEQDVFQVNHRHVVFTIDEGLREIFLL